MSKRKTKSVAGEEVDFDLLETKQKMEENKPRALEVKQREDFVHTKRRSRGRRSVMQKLKERRDNTTKQSEKPDTTKKKTTQSEKSKKSSSTKKKKTRKIVKDDG